MRPHLSIFVTDVKKTADFYSKVFGQEPQKQTNSYAKFDLKNPALNFTFMSSPKAELSRVSHLGVEVDSAKEVREWKNKLEEAGVLTRDELNVDCCFANQDKVWFSDPDGNEWEVFYVKEQLEVPTKDSQVTCQPKTSCCG